VNYKKNFFIDDKNAESYIAQIGQFIFNEVRNAKRHGVILGMSGGIDCSVVARLCQEAGVDTKLVMLPDGDSMNNSSSTDAMKLIEKFEFKHATINIKDACDAIEKSIIQAGAKEISDLSRSNIRPRVRMTTLYSLAQDERRFVVGTSNLDERLLGYFTKWGDGACDLNPLAMLTKGEVRTLAKHLGVPESIITKAPSAGLQEGQTDEVDLGFSYEAMDDYILTGTSGSREIDQKIRARIAMSGHKLTSPPIFLGLRTKERVL